MGVHTLDTETGITGLVSLLRSEQRDRPIVLVATQPGDAKPVIDVDKIASDVGHLADIYVIKTGRLTYFLGDLMAPGAHAFGNAGRVYPLGSAWEQQLHLSPLRIPVTAADGPRLTELLIDDTIAFAAPPIQSLSNPVFDQAILNRIQKSLAKQKRQPAVTAPTPRPTPAVTVTPSPQPAVPAPLVVPEPVAARLAQTPLSGAARVALAIMPAAVVPIELPAPVKKSTALATTQLALTGAKSRITQLEQEALSLEATIRHGVRAEMQTLILETSSLTRQLIDCRARATEQIIAARKKTVKADCPTSGYRPELFLDAADAVRLAITTAWAERIPAADKAGNPLPEYTVGAEFAGSLEKLDDAQLTKAFKAIVYVLTDTSRVSTAIHPLRNGVGADDGPTTRDDGAVCFRANIEAKTASARRLHYWKLPTGQVELARVVTHDDMQP